MKKQHKAVISVLAVGLVTLAVYQTNGQGQKVESKPIKISHVEKAGVHLSANLPSAKQLIDKIYAQAHYKKNQTRNIGKFNRIKLNTNRLYIKITSGKGFKVKVSGPNVQKIKTGVRNQTLTIFSQRHSLNKKQLYRVIVTVPNKTALKEVMGTGYNSNLSLHSLTIPKINVKLNNGSSSLTNVKARNLKADIKKGDFQATNSTLAGKAGNQISVSHGDAIVKKSKLVGKNAFNLTDGDFKMKYAPQLNYQLSTGNGGKVFLRGSEKSAHYVKQASSSDTLKVTATGGDIWIN